MRPGTDLALLNGLLRLVRDAGGVDTEFVAGYTEGWEPLDAMLDEYPADLVADITGIDEADLRAVADLICGTKNWVSLWTMGLNQSTHGTWNTNAVCNLHLATGAICRPGAGPFSLTGQPNAMGGREMGYMGPGLPGQRSALDRRRPGLRRRPLEARARDHPRRGRHRHHRHVPADGRRARSGRRGSSAPIPLPRCRIGPR